MNFWNIARPEESPVLKKTLSIMRLTTLFSIACSLQISASVYSQETKLSLDVNNQTIKEVLFRIEKQSGFRFIYESEKVNLNKKVSVHVKEQTVETILKRLFAGEGVKIASAISPITLIRENIIDLCVLIVFTVCVWIFAATKKRIGKVEGFCMIALYVAYAIYIVIR